MPTPRSGRGRARTAGPTKSTARAARVPSPREVDFAIRLDAIELDAFDRMLASVELGAERSRLATCAPEFDRQPDGAPRCERGV